MLRAVTWPKPITVAIPSIETGAPSKTVICGSSTTLHVGSVQDVGITVGAFVGKSIGERVGKDVGEHVGECVGEVVGEEVGEVVGDHL